MNAFSTAMNQPERPWREPTLADPLGEADSLLDTLLAKDASTSRQKKNVDSKRNDAESLASFLTTSDPIVLLKVWFGSDFFVRHSGAPWREFIKRLQSDIARIDQCISRVLNAILHHPDFQRLEASWRGLAYLAECKDRVGDAPIRIRVLNVKWTELGRDFDRALEFDQSQLFKKVYEEGIGTPGADPFSTIIADFEVHPRPRQDHQVDDMAIVTSIAQVAAAAFCPTILNAAPTMFAVDRFEDLQSTIELESIHSGLDFFAWKKLRESEDSRFVAFAVPRMLMRQPYRDYPSKLRGFPFEEQIAQRDDYLWGGAAFGMGEVLMRSFADSRWLADIRGAQRGVEKGGLVLGPTVDAFKTEGAGVADKPLTDLVVNDVLERELSRLGFLPLCQCKDIPMAAFYSCPSVQKATSFNTPEAQVNAKLSAMLNYILCASRFAHYTKVIARNLLGSLIGAEEIERRLQDWIIEYVTSDPDANVRIKSERPLRAAEIRVRAIPGRPGEYDSILYLSPNHELDDLQASIRLDTRLAPPRN